MIFPVPIGRFCKVFLFTWVSPPPICNTKFSFLLHSSCIKSCRFSLKDLWVIKCWSLSIFGQRVKLLCLSKLHQKYWLARRAIVQNLPQPTVLRLAIECCKIDMLYRLLQAWKFRSSILVTSTTIIQLPSHRVTLELRKSHIQGSLEQAITSDTCKGCMEILWYTNNHWNSFFPPFLLDLWSTQRSCQLSHF